MVFLATAALLGGAGTAAAADIPIRSRGYVDAPQAFSWSGFYLGLHAGYGWGSSDWTIVDSSVPVAESGAISARGRGFLGGIQAGANHQLGNWVLGIEADVSLADGVASGTGPTTGFDVGLPAGFTARGRSQIDWLTMFTARFGYAFDRSLLYFKGGVAGARFIENYALISPPLAYLESGNQSNTRIGWTIGGGWEYAILNNWTAKIEYNYLDFGTKEETFVTPNGPIQLAIYQTIDRRLHLVKLGVNYKF